MMSARNENPIPASATTMTRDPHVRGPTSPSPSVKNVVPLK